ncbi:MAG: HAMP domain-containing histidine kinase [Chitinispirillaceae bacterium]|nr:HAMP domain-containing histidine kinase [Chitinispirillaceae bacterium]
MRKNQTHSLWRPGILFFTATVLPGLALSVLTIRAARHEEAFMEKQLENTFYSELSQTVYSIQKVLESVRETLDGSLAETGRTGFPADWDRTTDLVGIPFQFQLDSGFTVPSRGGNSPEEKLFVASNTGFFLDRQPVEIYRSISDEYAESVIAAAKQTSSFQSGNNGRLLRKQASDAFETDKNVQKEIYSQLRSRGRVVPLRNIVSGSKTDAKVEAYTPRLSTYVTESMHFSDIVATAPSGFIPRIIDQRFMLLYWKKLGTATIAGCVVDMDAVTDKILSVLPQLQTAVRIVTVLDHNGKPVFDSGTASPPDWKHPFTAREISGLLPRWEVAMYLTDPAALSSRARITTLSLILLAGILFTVIAISGFILLKTMQSEMKLAQQKTTFVANVSHELKTPLTSIRIFAELLKERRQPDPLKQEQYLGIIISETERLTRLINNVLDFSRSKRSGRTYSKRECDLNGLSRELAENQRVRLEHNRFTFVTAYSAEVLPATVDPEAIKQALLNILSNAEKYSSDTRWISFSLGREGSDAIIRIADRGIGIDPAEQENIFREFFRVDDSLAARVQGTGLGLTITRQILRDHGGDIRYQPNQPSGSEFVITLPLCKEVPGETENSDR